MLTFLHRQRAKLDDWLTRQECAHTFSLPVYQLYQQTLRLISDYASGPCLDAGSGRSPWKRRLERRGIQVVSLDIEDRAGEVDLIADLQHMPVADASMRTVLCTQVLEHVPRPWKAVAEIARVLESGGYVILSVPHLSVIHEAPRDYYRYTRFGLAALLSSHDLVVLQIQESGGLVSFLAHSWSMLLLGVLGAFPGLRWMSWGINYVVLIHGLGLIDRIFGAARIYPCNYVVVARKGQQTSAQGDQLPDHEIWEKCAFP